jgi:hypothetical protein
LKLTKSIESLDSVRVVLTPLESWKEPTNPAAEAESDIKEKATVERERVVNVDRIRFFIF